MNTEEALAQREWYIVDAEGKILGRMASEIAKVLRGKNKAIFHSQRGHRRFCYRHQC